jgi:flagellar protein FliO/FliZ
METTYYIQVGLAFVLVLALMGLLSFILKKVNYAQSGMMSKDSRLKIVEQRMIDSKTKVAIIRCDDKDHLVVLGQNSTIVVETDLKKPKSNA